MLHYGVVAPRGGMHARQARRDTRQQRLLSLGQASILLDPPVYILNTLIFQGFLMDKGRAHSKHQTHTFVWNKNSLRSIVVMCTMGLSRAFTGLGAREVLSAEPIFRRERRDPRAGTILQ